MKEYIIVFIVIFAVASAMRALTRLREDLSYTNYILHRVVSHEIWDEMSSM